MEERKEDNLEEKIFSGDSVVDDRNTYEDTEDGYYLTLCILFLERISLALLMDKYTDNRTFRSIVSF